MCVLLQRVCRHAFGVPMWGKESTGRMASSLLVPREEGP